MDLQRPYRLQAGRHAHRDRAYAISNTRALRADIRYYARSRRKAATNEVRSRLSQFRPLRSSWPAGPPTSAFHRRALVARRCAGDCLVAKAIARPVEAARQSYRQGDGPLGVRKAARPPYARAGSGGTAAGLPPPTASVGVARENGRAALAGEHVGGPSRRHPQARSPEVEGRDFVAVGLQALDFRAAVAAKLPMRIR